MKGWWKVSEERNQFLPEKALDRLDFSEVTRIVESAAHKNSDMAREAVCAALKELNRRHSEQLKRDEDIYWSIDELRMLMHMAGRRMQDIQAAWQER